MKRNLAISILAGFAACLSPAVGFAQMPTNFVTLADDGAWTWFNDPRALFYNNTLYFGYNRAADGNTVLSTLNLQTGVVSNLWTGSLTLTDDHYVPGLQVKSDGTMLAIYSRHQNDQFFMYRLSTTTNPVASSAWGAEQTNNTHTNVSSGMTYSNPYQLAAENGKIYNFARYLNYNPNVFTSTNGGATWSTPQILIQTGTGGTRPYVKYCSDYNQRIDVLYTDAHPDNYTNSLYHMYYQGGSFYQTDGTFLKSYANLPILHDSGQRGTVVYQYSDAPQSDPNQWIPTARAWCWEIAYQANSNPVCVFQTKVDNVTGSNWYDARIYYYYATWTGTNWQKRFIAQAGRPLYDGQPDYGGGIGLDPQNPNVIYISTDAANPFDLTTTTNVALGANYEIWSGVTTNGGLTFTWQSITTNSTVDNLRPYVPRRNGGEPSVLWFRGTYTSYTDFSCSIVGLFTTQVPQTNAASGSGTWIADADGVWSDPTKWLNGTIASGAGNVADFSTIDITADRTVTLDSSRSVGTLRFGDTSGTQNWTLASSGGSVLTLDTGSTAVPSIVVNQNTATIAAPLAGVNGLTKSSAGTLILSGVNTLGGTLYADTGQTSTGDDGVLRLAGPGAIGGVTNLDIRSENSATSTLQLDGTSGDVSVSAHMAVNCRNTSVATIENLAGTNTLSGSIELDIGGSLFNIQSDAGLLIFSGTNQYGGVLTGARAYAFSGAGNHLVSGPILNSTNGAPIGLTKSGAGQLTLTAANTYTNGTTVNGGTLVVNGSIVSNVTVASSATLSGKGTINGAVTIANGATLSPGDPTGTLTVKGNFVVNNSSTLAYALGASSDLTAVSSNLTLGGTLVVTNAGGLTSGTYTLFTYGGALTYTPVGIGTTPAGFNCAINTNTRGQVKLVVTQIVTPPGANFTASPISGVQPLPVTFADISTGTPPLSLTWILGDNTTNSTANGANFGHTYAAGTYTVTLIASNSAGTSTLVSNNLITVITALQSWQQTYFGCTGCPQAAGNVNSDGDGFSNTNEFLAGFNPTNPAAYLHIISIAVTNGTDIRITYLGSNGDTNYPGGPMTRTNVLEFTAGMAGGSYTNNFASTGLTNVLSGGVGLGTNVTVTDPFGATNSPARYYRVRVLVP